jgi:SH3 domain-containing YSC84-like protein 1
MKRATITAVLGFATVLQAENANDRLKEASDVVQEMMKADDKGIPRDLLESAKCAVIIPAAKQGGFFVGAQYGRGFVICRNDSAKGWGAPAAVRMEGGTFGLQVGAAETDIFMLVMNDEGMKKLLDSKFTLDANAGIAAGPLGRSASAKTDARVTAGILAWSRSRGVFGGLTIGGGTLRDDIDENEELYGKRLTNKEIVLENTKPPASASTLIASLNGFTKTEATRPAAAK